MQIKSLQALFDPRTLHEKCYTEKSTKNTHRPSREPLRNRNLPPSFFKEPARANHYPELISERIDVNEICNVEPFDFDELTVESIPTLPNDSLESIIDQTCDSIYSDQYQYSVYNEVSPYHPRGSYSCHVTEGYFDSYNGHSPGAPDLNEVNGELHDTGASDCNFVPNMATVDSSHCLQTSNVCAMQNSGAEIYQNSFCDFQSDNAVEGFLPLLNETFERYIPTSFTGDKGDNCSHADVLPNFPQTFCSRQKEERDTLDGLLYNGSPNWDTPIGPRPCYMYL